MKEFEFKFLTTVLWVVLFLGSLLLLKNWHDDYMTKKGIAIANYLSYANGMTVSPDEAKYFNVSVSSYDVTVEQMEIFMPRK